MNIDNNTSYTRENSPILFLTSGIGGYQKIDGIRYPEALLEDNNFIENLKKRWKDNLDVLLISSNPSAYDWNDMMTNTWKESFSISGLTIGKFDICDNRNLSCLDTLQDYQALLLAGGHVPTQNEFFNSVHLRNRLVQYKGIILSISAGTMNSADVVYAQPELDGESTDPSYKRFLLGLSLTKQMILPHYDMAKHSLLDGKRVFEDITYPDSYGREFLAFPEGTYLLIEDGVETIYGEAYRIKDGILTKLCELNYTLILT